jgi:DNA-binding HxlR family transcriptional regulator
MKRAGATVLALLASPLNIELLQALEGEHMGALDLRRAVGSPPQSTMRLYLQGLTERGVIERRRQGTFPPIVEYALTDAGQALLKVRDCLLAWLGLAPEGAISLGTPAAKHATRALVEGWSTNIVRAMAARPYSLTELSKVNIQTSYPALERRLSAMRLVNLVEPHPGDGRGTPYKATEWLRRAVMPMVGAVGWERKHLAKSTPGIGRLDVEAAFLLAVPLMVLSSDTTCTCRLAVELQGGADPTLAGAVIGIEGGKLASCSSRLEGKEVDAWVAGSAMAWLRQMDGEPISEVEFGGDRQLAESIIETLRATGRAYLDPLEESLG